MLKNALKLLILLVVLFALALWSPWYKWQINIYNLLGIENNEKYSSLKITSLSGEIEIYIDDEYQGSVTDNEDYVDIASIKSGEHHIALKRKSQTEYFVYEKTIIFEQGAEVVIAFDLGPNETFSEGHTFYTKRNYINIGKPRLFVYSAPDMTKVFIDDILVGETPLLNVDLDLSQQRKVRFQHDGYEDLEFTILPDSIESRNKLLDFDLIIEAKLFLKPVKVVNL